MKGIKLLAVIFAVFLALSGCAVVSTPTHKLYWDAWLEVLTNTPEYGLVKESSKDHPDGGKVEERFSYHFSSGEPALTFIATPKEGCRFVGWYTYDELLSTDPVYNYTVKNHIPTLIAVFSPLPLSAEETLPPPPPRPTFAEPVPTPTPELQWVAWLNVSTSSAEYGAIQASSREYLTGEEKGESYSYYFSEGSNPSVTFTALPKEGCRFDGWYSGKARLLSTENTYTYTIQNPVSNLVAVFSPIN